MLKGFEYSILDWDSNAAVLNKSKSKLGYARMIVHCLLIISRGGIQIDLTEFNKSIEYFVPIIYKLYCIAL